MYTFTELDYAVIGAAVFIAVIGLTLSIVTVRNTIRKVWG